MSGLTNNQSKMRLVEPIQQKIKTVAEAKKAIAAGKVLGLQSYGKVREEWKAPLKKFFTSSVPYWYNLEIKKKTLSDEIGIEFSGDNRLNGDEGNDFARTAQEVFEEVFFEKVDSIDELDPISVDPTFAV